MSTDYSSVLGVGFVLPLEEALDPFRKVSPETSHTEDRYDEKTGEKLDPVRVVDREEGDTFMWPGEPKSETEDSWDFIYFIAEKLRCDSLTFGNHMGDRDDIFVLFGAEVKSDNESGIEGVECGHINFAGNLSYESVVEVAAELKALKERMENYGLKPKEAVIQNCWTIC